MTKPPSVDIIKCTFILIDGSGMSLSLKRIRNILLAGSGITFLFLAFLFSDNTMVGFSEFKFLSGGFEVDTLNFEMIGGDTTGFSVKIYNKESIAMTYRLGFVDAGITNDSFTQKACLSQNETGLFGQYVAGDTSLFTIPANDSITKTLSVTFPIYATGLVHGCIMFFPVMTGISTSVNSGEITTDMNTLPRRGGFIDILVHPNVFKVNVKAFPGNRVYQATNNTNTGIVKIYDTNKTLISMSPLFSLNSAGTGEAFINAPIGTYYVVFKGQSHLASYLSGVTIGGTGNDYFDFTTGSNLYGAQNLDSQTDNGKKYQTAGDLKNTDGDYDFVINGNDISIILYDTFPVNAGANVLDPRNLNGDTAINASDLSIIGTNCLQQDAFATVGGIFIW